MQDQKKPLPNPVIPAGTQVEIKSTDEPNAMPGHGTPTFEKPENTPGMESETVTRPPLDAMSEENPDMSAAVDDLFEQEERASGLSESSAEPLSEDEKLSQTVEVINSGMPVPEFPEDKQPGEQEEGVTEAVSLDQDQNWKEQPTHTDDDNSWTPDESVTGLNKQPEDVDGGQEFDQQRELSEGNLFLVKVENRPPGVLLMVDLFNPEDGLVFNGFSGYPVPENGEVLFEKVGESAFFDIKVYDGPGAYSAHRRFEVKRFSRIATVTLGKSLRDILTDMNREIRNRTSPDRIGQLVDEHLPSPDEMQLFVLHSLCDALGVVLPSAGKKKHPSLDQLVEALHNALLPSMDHEQISHMVQQILKKAAGNYVTGDQLKQELRTVAGEIAGIKKSPMTMTISELDQRVKRQTEDTVNARVAQIMEELKKNGTLPKVESEDPDKGKESKIHNTDNDEGLSLIEIVSIVVVVGAVAFKFFVG